MALEWSNEDAQLVGVMFEKEMLKTDTQLSEQQRKGSAVLKVMDRILDELLVKKEEETEDEEA